MNRMEHCGRVLISSSLGQFRLDYDAGVSFKMMEKPSQKVILGLHQGKKY
jgi:hypothetical protein